MLRHFLISPCLHVTASTKTTSAFQAKISAFGTQRVSPSASSEKVRLYRYSSKLSPWKALLTLCTDTSPTLTLLHFRISSVSAAPTHFGTNTDEECSHKPSAQVTRTTRQRVFRCTLSRCNTLFKHHHERQQDDKIYQTTSLTSTGLPWRQQSAVKNGARCPPKRWPQPTSQGASVPRSRLTTEATSTSGSS
jgi:hypothetical protein